MDTTQPKAPTIAANSVAHTCLLALRATGRASIDELMPWFPRRDKRTVAAALARLRNSQFISAESKIKGSDEGTGYIYQLSATGAALVDPKTGPLARRKTMEAIHDC